MDKLQLRRAIRERKRAMTEEEIVSRSEKLAELFYASDAYKNAKTIYGYLHKYIYQSVSQTVQ